MGAWMILLLIFSFIVYGQEKYYCIQVISSRNLSEAERVFLELKHLPHARIERIGSFYTVRIGFWKNKNEYKKYIEEISQKYHTAFPRTCLYLEERIVKLGPRKGKTETKHASLKFWKEKTLIVQGASEKEKICKAILKLFDNVNLKGESSSNSAEIVINYTSTYPYSVEEALNRVIIDHKKNGFIPTACSVSKKGNRYKVVLKGLYADTQLNIGGAYVKYHNRQQVVLGIVSKIN